MKKRLTRLVSSILVLAMLAELLPGQLLKALIPQAAAAEPPAVIGFDGIPQPEELPTTVEAEIPPTILIGEDMPAVNQSVRTADLAAYTASAEETTEEEAGDGSGIPGIDAPYLFDVENDEKINLSNGDLLYSCTDYTIPGINGLDLVIGRNYNSRYADMTIKIEDQSAVEDYGVTHSVLGQGWAWNFSSITEIPNAKNEKTPLGFLRLADGTVLKLNGHSSTGGIVRLSGYSEKIRRLRNVKRSGDGKEETAYILEYLDGKKEYFNGYGKLTQISDSYETHSIQFSYDTANGFERITITDTLGNKAVISSEENASGYITTTVTLPNEIMLQYQSVKQTEPYAYCALECYTNAVGQKEWYSYTQQAGNENTTAGTLGYNLNLTTVTHQTGAQTQYTYEKYNAFVEHEYTSSMAQFPQAEFYRITSRWDQFGQDSQPVNHKCYSYSEEDISYAIYFSHGFQSDVTVTEGDYQSTYGYGKDWTGIGKHTESVSYQGALLYKTTIKDDVPKIQNTVYYNYRSDEKDYKVTTANISKDSYDRVTCYTRAEDDLARYSYQDDQIKESNLFLSKTTALTTQNRIEKNKITESVISLDSVNDGTVTPGTVQRRTRYEYDDNGNLIKELRCTNPAEEDSDQQVYVPVAEYTYQNGAYLSQVLYRDVQTADGTAASTPNQPAGTIATSYSYDTLGRMTAMADANGYTTQYTYDVLGNLTGVVNPDGTRTSYVRDYVNNILTYSDENNNQTRYTYTPLGLPQDVIDVLTGNVLSRREYDSMSRLIRLTDYVYGSVTEYTYDGYGNVNSETVLQGNTVLSRTTWVYNEPTADGQYLRNTKTVHGDSNTPDIVTTEYLDAYGNVAKTGRIIDGTEYFDTYTYDFQGTVLSVLRAADAAKNLPFTEKYEYNYNNQVIKHTNAAGQVITNTYDAFDRLVQTTDYAGTPTTYTYDSLGRLLTKSVEVNPGDLVITKYEYDPAGNLTRERWPVLDYGESTPFWSERRYVYGSRNQRLETVELYDWDALAATTTYTYDPTGKLASVTSHNKTTSYTYDRYDNVLTMTDGLGQTESYEYNALGKVTSRTDRNGQTTVYGYDAMGRLGMELTEHDYRQYDYGPTGKLTFVDNGWYQTHYAYDDAGRLVQVEENEMAGASLQYTKSYTYDLNDNRTGFTLELDGGFSQNISYTYDSLNRLSTVSEDDQLQATYTYDANGNRATLTYANGVVESYTYNKANWVTSVTNRLGDTVLSSYAYTYYPTGNQKTKTDHTGKKTTYVYDGLGRLEQEYDNAGLNICYFYDASHNRHFITYKNGSENYELYYYYDANNQLTQERKRQDGKYTTVATYTYDGNGNQLTKTTDEGTAAFTYNAFNQQTQYRLGALTAQYVYNVDGIRTSKTVNGQRTTFLLDGGNVAAEVQDGQVTASYLRGINLISQDVGYDRRYYQYNAHGDVVTLTDRTGSVSKSYDYTAFGIESDPDADDENPFRYCGEYFDNETGTYYLRARYYDPSIGRFTQPDSHWNSANRIYGDNPEKINEREDALGNKLYSYRPQVSAILQSGNLYVYGMNNPVMYVDPTGGFVMTTAMFIAAGSILVFGTAGGIIGGMIADQNGITGWKRTLCVAGGTLAGSLGGVALASAAAPTATLAGTAGAAMGTAAAPATIGNAYTATQIGQIIATADSNKIHHIMQAKHAWNLVGAKDWSEVSAFICTALEKGASALNEAGNIVYRCIVDGQTVEVETRIVNGATRLVDAWIKTK